MKTLFAIVAILVCLNVFSQDTIFITSTAYPDLTEHEYNPDDNLCDPVLLGTMPWAFLKALDSEEEVVYIHFNILGQGPHIIYATYALPQITRRIIIDATTQSGYQTGLPAIILDGGENVNHGISFHGVSNSVVKGICIRNFQYTGIFCNNVNYSVFTENVIYHIYRNLMDLMLGEGNIGLVGSSYNTFKGNILGTDNNGNIYSNRFAGINFQKIPSDRIMTPSSSGNFIGGIVMGEGNTITNNAKGIAVGAGCTGNRISGNRIFNNSKGIFLSQGTIFPPASGGNNYKQAPEIETFDGTIITGYSFPNDTIEVFGSSEPEDANEYLTIVTADSVGSWTTNVSTTYQGVIATATDYHNNTSSLSLMKIIEIPFPEEPGPIYSPNGIFDTVYDRFGNSYTLDQIRFEKSQSKTLTSQVCGAFEIFFETNCGMEDDLDATQNARRSVLCQVLNDISDFLNVSTNTNRVNLWIRDFSQTSAPSSVGAVGSAFYLVPFGNPSIGGIVDNQVWKTLISNVDAFTNSVSPLNYTVGSGFYHGMLSINFSNYSWNTNLSNTSISNFDLYTIILHELMHDLGFNTLINSIGDSQLGTDRNYKSRYDLFLRASNNAYLLNTPTPASVMYNYLFNSTLNSSNLISTSCNTAVKYFSSLVDQITYTPPSYIDEQSLSHFDEQCCTLPYPLNSYFVMTYSTSTGMVKRYLKPEERNVLCDLGYNVQSMYGSIANNTFYDYGSSCSSGMVVGVNDGINSNSSYTFIYTGNNTGSPLSINPTINDVPNSGILIEGVEQIIGTHNLLTVNGNQITFRPTSAGLNVLRYVPYNIANSVRGNITYIFVFRLENCVPNVCDLVTNGDFEALIHCGDVTIGSLLGTNPLPCWYRLFNSTDFFRRNCVDEPGFNIPSSGSESFIDVFGTPNDCYMGMGSYDATHPEAMQTMLSSPLIPGENYLLSFVVKSWPLYPLNIQPYITVHFDSSPTILTSVSSSYFNTTPLVPYNLTQVPHDGNWHVISNIPFTFSGNVPHNNLIIANNTQNSEGFPSYFYIDNISIKPADNVVTLDLPSSICQYETIDDLSLYASPPGGVFSGPNVSGNAFYAGTSGVNTITYTVTNPNGCVYFETDDIIVAPTPPEPIISMPECLFAGTSSFAFVVDNPAPNTGYTWEYSDGGAPYSGVTINKPFSESGYYCVNVTATNNTCTSNSSQSFFVMPNECFCDQLSWNLIDHTISATGTYSFLPFTRIFGDLIIDGNSTVTIENSTLYFSPKGRVIVKNGSTLILDNTTLTDAQISGCPNAMWQGIEVWGNYMPSTTGLIVIGNNVKIENAHIGVLLGGRNFNYLCRPDLQTTYPPGSYNSIWSPISTGLSGGKISVKSVSVQDKPEFKNNGIGIFILRTKKFSWSAGNKINNIKFTCTQMLDPLYNISNPNHYPNIFNPFTGRANELGRTDASILIDNILFNSTEPIKTCLFENTEYGILSFNSKFNVIENIFDIAYTGVRISNSVSGIDYQHKISGNHFRNIPNNPFKGFGVYIEGGTSDVIEGNFFGEVYLDQQNNYDCGIFIDNSTNFKITNNKFYYIKRGIYVRNTGLSIAPYIGAASPNWWPNEFYNCKTGIITHQTNKFLKIKCNEHHNPNVSFYYTNWSNKGQLAQQGQPVPTQPGIIVDLANARKCPAGNEFYPESDDQKKQIRTMNIYKYYRHDDPPQTIPANDLLAPIQVGIFPSVSQSSQFYPLQKLSNTASCGIPMFGIDIGLPLPSSLSEYPFSIIDSVKDEVEMLLQEYAFLCDNLDNGNTSQLLHATYSNMSQGNLKNLCVANSPLSDTVLISLITRNRLSPGNMKLVMERNLPVSDNVLPFFNALLQILPTGIAKQLEALNGNNLNYVTPTLLKSRADYLEGDRRLLLGQFIQVLTDSVNNRRDDALTLISRENDIDFRRLLISSYISGDDLLFAQNELFLFDDMNEEELTDWKWLMQTYISEATDSSFVFDDNILNEIRRIAYKCPRELSSANAASILFRLYRETVPECDETANARNIIIPKQNFKSENEAWLEDNFPEPFGNYTVLKYYCPENENGRFEITDISGRILVAFVAEPGEKTAIVNTETWSAGIYFCKYIVNDKPIETIKLVKNEK